MALTQDWLSQALLALVALCTCLFPTRVFSQAQFFQGKTVTIVQGRDPGGTGDMRVRAMVPFLQNIFRGTRRLLTSTCPAEEAGKRQITSTDQCALMGSLSETSGLAWFLPLCLESRESHYDLDKFFYLGSPFSSHHAIFFSRKVAGLSSIEKLRAAEGIRIGGQSVGFSTYIEGRLFAYILGLKDPNSSPVTVERNWTRC